MPAATEPVGMKQAVTASDGVSLDVEVHGEGPVVVFSCALNTTRENWRPQVAPLVAAGHPGC